MANEKISLPWIARIPYPLRYLIQTIGWRFFFLLTTKRQAQGLPLFFLSLDPEPDEEDLLRKATEALELVARLDPIRMRRLRRTVRRVLIVQTFGTDGEYWSHLSTLVLSLQHVRRAQPDQIALTLIHEATHARLRHLRIATNRANRVRVERACIGEELAFARRLPNPEHWIAVTRAKRLDPAFWTDEAIRQRGVRAYSDWKASQARAPAPHS